MIEPLPIYLNMSPKRIELIFAAVLLMPVIGTGSTVAIGCGAAVLHHAPNLDVPGQEGYLCPHINIVFNLSKMNKLERTYKSVYENIMSTVATGLKCRK